MTKTSTNAIMNETAIEVKMATILGSLLALLVALVQIQTRKESCSSSSNNNSNGAKDTSSKSFLDQLPLPCAVNQPSKRAYEIYSLYYTPVWIGMFGIVVAFQIYEDLDAFGYDALCLGLALPFLLQPLLWVKCKKEADRNLADRYCTKANLWIAVYSFIGNYWYTHYFYSVLKAKYTMPAHRLNNVPIAMFFATHFYFSTYHVFSNMLLRWVVTSFQDNVARKVLFWGTIICFSYFTAFMETLTISSYPYYSFEDRNMAYTIGSAFYGIYFLVSFPMFFYFDDDIDKTDSDATKAKQITLWDTFVHSCGAGMIILFILDFVRLYIGVNLIVGE